RSRRYARPRSPKRRKSASAPGSARSASCASGAGSASARWRTPRISAPTISPMWKTAASAAASTFCAGWPRCSASRWNRCSRPTRVRSGRTEACSLPTDRRIALQLLGLLHHDFGRGGRFGAELARDLHGHAAEDLRVFAVGRRGDEGPAAVRGFADREIERHFAEKRHAEFLGLVARTAMRENIGALAAMRAQEIAHVLHDAENRHFDLAEHGDALARVDQREVLWRRDDDRAGQRHLLR